MTTAERLSVIDAGYTYQEDEEGNAEAQDRQYALWAPYGISVLHTYNTWQRLMPDGSIQYDLQHTLNMMARWGEKGRFAILFNTGLGAPVDVRGPNDQAIWEAQNNWWPSGVQTMTLTKMRNQFFTDPVSTVQLAIDLGFIDVEIPLGVHNDANELYRIDTTEAATLNAGLAGNVAEGQDP